MSSTSKAVGGGSSLSVGVIVAIAVVGTVVVAALGGVLCAYIAHRRRQRLHERRIQKTKEQESSQTALQPSGLPMDDASAKAAVEAATRYFNPATVVASSPADRWSLDGDSELEGTGFTWWWRCRWRRLLQRQDRPEVKLGQNGELPLYGSGENGHRAQQLRTRNKLQRPRPAAPKIVSSSNFSFMPMPMPEAMAARKRSGSNTADAGQDGVTLSNGLLPQRPAPPPPQLRLITPSSSAQTSPVRSGPGAVPRPLSGSTVSMPNAAWTPQQKMDCQSQLKMQNMQNIQKQHSHINGLQLASAPYVYASGSQRPVAPAPNGSTVRPVLPPLMIPAQNGQQPQHQPQPQQRLQLQRQFQQYQQAQRIPTRPQRSVPQKLSLSTDSALSEILRSTEKRLQQLQAQSQTKPSCADFTAAAAAAKANAYTGDEDDDVFTAAPTLARQREQCRLEEAAARKEEAAASAAEDAKAEAEALEIQESLRSSQRSGLSGVSGVSGNSDADSMFVDDRRRKDGNDGDDDDATTTALSSPSRSPTRTADISGHSGSSSNSSGSSSTIRVPTTVSAAAGAALLAPPKILLVPGAKTTATATGAAAESTDHDPADASTSPESGSSSAYSSPPSTRSSLSTVYSADERPEAVAKNVAGLGITMVMSGGSGSGSGSGRSVVSDGVAVATKRGVFMQPPAWQQQQALKPQGPRSNNGIRGSFGGAIAPVLAAPAGSTSAAAPLLLQPSSRGSAVARTSPVRLLVTSPTAESLAGSSPGRRRNVTADVTDMAETAHVQIAEDASATAAVEADERHQQQQQQRRQSLTLPITQLNLTSLVEALPDVPENAEAVGAAGPHRSVRPLPAAPSRLSAASLTQQQQQQQQQQQPQQADNRASTLTTNSLLATAAELRRMNSVAHSEASTVYSDSTSVSPALQATRATFSAASSLAGEAAAADNSLASLQHGGRRSRLSGAQDGGNCKNRASVTGSRHYLSLGAGIGSAAQSSSGSSSSSSSSDKENDRKEIAAEGGNDVGTASAAKRQRPFSFVGAARTPTITTEGSRFGEEESHVPTTTPNRSPSRSPSKTGRRTPSRVVISSNSVGVGNSVKTPGSRSPTKAKLAGRTPSYGTPIRTPTRAPARPSPGQRGSLGLYDPDGFLISSSPVQRAA